MLSYSLRQDSPEWFPITAPIPSHQVMAVQELYPSNGLPGTLPSWYAGTVLPEWEGWHPYHALSWQTTVAGASLMSSLLLVRSYSRIVNRSSTEGFKERKLLEQCYWMHWCKKMKRMWLITQSWKKRHMTEKLGVNEKEPAFGQKTPTTTWWPGPRAAPGWVQPGPMLIST